MEHYLSTTNTADDWVLSVHGQTAVVGSRFEGREQALAWLDAERANLVAAVVMAADTGRDKVAMALALYLAGFLLWRRQLDDGVTVALVAVRAAGHLQDPHLRANSLTNLGLALREVRRFEEAIAALTTTIGIYRETGDRHGEGKALAGLGLALADVQRLGEAGRVWEQAVVAFEDTGDDELARMVRGWLDVIAGGG